MIIILDYYAGDRHTPHTPGSADQQGGLFPGDPGPPSSADKSRGGGFPVPSPGGDHNQQNNR